jgi:hypothetical protein
MRLGVRSTKDAKIIGRTYGEWDLGSAPFLFCQNPYAPHNAIALVVTSSPNAAYND